MAIKGIDVSNHQGLIDWERVKNSGIRFAIIRAGYGRSNIDESFRRNAEGARKAGIPMGVYWFSYALSEAGALAEAKQCVSTIRNDPVKLPVFYDFEAVSVQYAKEQGVNVTKADYNRWVRVFCEYVADSGYKAGVYYNLDFKRNWVDQRIIGKYYQWLAYYTTEKQTDYAVQQYSSTGRVDGISGNVDLDWVLSDRLVKIIENHEHGSDGNGQERRIRYIKRLQEALNEAYDAGLAVDGSAGPLTRKAIERHYLYYKMPTIKNAHVGWLQEVLRLLGYSIDRDNSYGPATEKVVRQFQQEHGLAVDGYAGVETHLALLNLL